MTIVRLPNATRLENLKKEIEEFRSEFLLFVNSVREIRLRVVGADANFVTSHVSRDLGDGRFRIERPEGDHDEWYVENRMHTPSPEARIEVGEAVSRDRMKVTVAMPARFAQLRTGEFWSYFPLQDRTSASALFNAPWSVNDDRTTLLANRYNREILVTLSEMFLHALPKISSADDPAAHLDYMPARGREAHSFGDEILCVYVPQLGCEKALIPDATGALRTPPELRPLDFGVNSASERDHEEWIKSPNTDDDVPHWRCYASSQRVARLRTIYLCSVSPAFSDSRPRDEKKALESIRNKRGILSWLREWAEGTDMASAGKALDFVVRNPNGLDSAKVVPTTDGMRSIRDRGQVYLHRADGIDVEGACFVEPSFLAIPGVERKLSDRGFRDLDSLAKFEARMAMLSPESEDDELPKFWKAATEAPMAQAQKVVAGNKAGALRVPTRDGGWALPTYVLDIDGLGDSAPDRVLDGTRCVPQLAHAAGVITEPVGSYSLEDEVHFEDYCHYVLDEVNRRLGPGERPVEQVEFDRGDGPGPFSALLMLQEAGASELIRERWTEGLIRLDQEGSWLCTDIDTGLSHRVLSPVRWAAGRAGLLKSTRGYRAPDRVVSASLVEYEALLPLFRGPRHVEAALALPKDLGEVPAEVLREALEAEVTSPISNAALTGFVLTASRFAFPEGHPVFIPARVGRTIERRRPDAVYLATTEEEREFLSLRQKPYLKVDEDEAEQFVEGVGCRRFEDSFSFSLLVDGQQVEERVIDLYTGLRSTFVEDKVTNATVAKAVQITKRVTTEDGVEDQSLEWHRQGLTVVVQAELDEHRVLQIVNGAFDLRLSNAELSDILQARVDRQLETQRQDARAASSDAERLAIFIGDDTLKENLPTGLWQALEGQGLVDDYTSVAELFLTVYGSDSIKLLAEGFSAEGYTDVPMTWAGGASTVAWLRKMGFGAKYAGRRTRHQDDEFVVPGAVKLKPLHDFQERISEELHEVLTSRGPMVARARAWWSFRLEPGRPGWPPKQCCGCSSTVA